MLRLILIANILVFSCATTARKPELPAQPKLAVELSPDNHSVYESVGTRFAVSAQGHAASEAAEKMFQLKGNIVDAFVAASFAVSVERLNAGIGGGGFLVFRRASGEVLAADFNVRAPGKAHELLFQDSQGNVIPKLSSEGGLSIATPGLIAGLLEVHSKFGSLPLATVLAPAIDVAEKGFQVYEILAKNLRNYQTQIQKYKATKDILFKDDDDVYELGDLLVQKDLGKTLRIIAKQGRKVFYSGALAEAIAWEVRNQGGILTFDDLKAFKVKWRKPIVGTFRGFRYYSMPPPSSGGIHIFQILSMLEDDAIPSLGSHSSQTIHLMASAMQQAFADRAKYIGDPEFDSIPVDELISRKYTSAQRKLFKEGKARHVKDVYAGENLNNKSSETTHLSIIDSEGNMISSTQSINSWFGSGIVVPGTGIFLNNGMDDFSAKTGSQNIYGAVGGSLNAIKPFKTPVSSMAPTIITEFVKGRETPRLAVGAPGGTRIITCIAQTIMNYLEHRLPLFESIVLPRYHHQWQPDELLLEPQILDSEVSRLESMGYDVRIDSVPCRVMAVAKEGDQLRAVSDPRDYGSVKAN